MDARDQELRTLVTEEIDKSQDKADSDPYRLCFHHRPPVGVLNAPGGLVQWKGVYHLFYQWLPFGSDDKTRMLGHYTSTDLIHWTHEKVALTPSDWFDLDGIHPGSAIAHEDRLYLFYTGVVEKNGEREFYQCAAFSKDGVNFEKEGVVVQRPEGYTGQFCNPKVFRRDDQWYMLVGAQNSDRQGEAVLFRSYNLADWNFVRGIPGREEGHLRERGYLWEHPDLFELSDQDVLIVSPHGLESKGMEYSNTYQSGYFSGTFNINQPRLDYGEFRELDRGFDFYAPKTTLDEHGRRILIGWMGLPDQNKQAHLKAESQWGHGLTVPRELAWNGEQMIQQPVDELKEMRGPVLLHSSITIENDQKAVRGIGGKCLELNIEFEKIDQQFAIELYQYAAISYTIKDHILTLSRPSLHEKSQTEFRRVRLKDGLRSLRLFIDHSSLELFVNEGEEVFTSKIFPQSEEENVLFTSLGESTFSLEQWKLDGFKT